MRAYLFVAATASALGAATRANTDALSVVDNGLITLPCGMAALKLVITLAAICMSFWSVENPDPLPVAFGYMAAVSCMVFASVSLWYLSFIALASAVFIVNFLR